MKKVYLVSKIDDKGRITGSIDAFSSHLKALKQRDYLNELFKTSNYIIEKLNVY